MDFEELKRVRPYVKKSEVKYILFSFPLWYLQR